MLRVVVDVNVLVSAVLRPDSIPGSVVSTWRRGLFELVVSPVLLEELRRVLGRPHLARYFTPADADELYDELRASAELVADVPAGRRLVPDDPDDDYLVALARAGRAHVIVTGDRDLLDVEGPPPVLTPARFLDWLDRLDL